MSDKALIAEVEYLRAENARLFDLVPTAYSGGFNDAVVRCRRLPEGRGVLDMHDECWKRSPVRALLADIGKAHSEVRRELGGQVVGSALPEVRR